MARQREITSANAGDLRVATLLRDRLDSILVHRRGEIDRVLDQDGVPRVRKVPGPAA